MGSSIFLSSPHSGEVVPKEAPWLLDLDELTLMCDVDRFVDELYAPAADRLKIGLINSQWHRYAVDLNRMPEDVDSSTVLGHSNGAGSFSRGLHWKNTTTGLCLMDKPITKELHETLIKKYYEPFHSEIRKKYDDFKAQGIKKVYHMDLHSMPSVGTSQHKDPGEFRADVVVSDVSGQSCDDNFTQLVASSYERAGFKVICNWPYQGGRITQIYGRPSEGCNAIQVELNRSLYMNEQTKQKNENSFEEIKNKLLKALEVIKSEVKTL